MKRSALGLAAILSPCWSAHGQAVERFIDANAIQSDGLLQFDGNWYRSDVQDLDAGGGAHRDYAIRNAQVFVKGERNHLKWVVGYEFKSEKWLDVNVVALWDERVRKSLQIGQFKQPNGLEALSSSKQNDFISQAMASNAFSLGRRLGVAYAFESVPKTARSAWALTTSIFGHEITQGLGSGSGFAMRGTWARNAVNSTLHLGISYADHDTDQDSWQIRARPNADLTPVRLVDTGPLRDADRVATLGSELLWTGAHAKLQAEYLQTRVDRVGSARTVRARGGYLSGVWNLTGGQWGYQHGLPTLSPDAAPRLWQVAARWDFIDSNDGELRGGRAESLSVGVNAYFGANFKAAFNYVKVRSKRDEVSDDPSIIEARAQWHW